jgi:hypothetical protein
LHRADQNAPDAPQDLAFARVEPTIGRRDHLTETDDKRPYRAVGVTAEAVNGSGWTAGLPELSDAMVEVRLHVLPREHGQEPVFIEKIQELPALDFLYPAISAGDQGGYRNDGIEKLVFAKIQIGGDKLRPFGIPPVSGSLLPHCGSLQRYRVRRRARRSGWGICRRKVPRNIDRSKRFGAEHGDPTSRG